MLGEACGSLVCRSGRPGAWECGGKLSMADLPAEGCRGRCGGGGGGFTSRAWASWRWCCWICCCRFVIVRATWRRTRELEKACKRPRSLLAGPACSQAKMPPRWLKGRLSERKVNHGTVCHLASCAQGRWALARAATRPEIPTCCSCCLMGPETLR